jgi:hypothetical protein
MDTTTTNAHVVVGQEVAVRARRSGWHYRPNFEFGYVVTKRTPAGQLVIEATRPDGSKRVRRFKPAGRYGRVGTYNEIGANEYNRGELVLDVAAARDEEARYELRQKACSALREAADHAAKLSQANPGWDKDTMMQALAEAESYCTAARLLVNALAD